ncbi:MAG: flagellar basal-body rod modification protein FlgD [Phycisphaerales bacterium]|jgi:flagellar basal-body rod modification protein FlgD
MSAIDSLNGRTNQATASGDAFAEITSGEFMQILFTELSAQDPLEPQDTQAILDQLGSLREIESNLKLQQNLKTLVDQNSFAAASNLIGNLVSGITLDNRRVFDLVISVSNTAEGPILNLLDGSRVHMDKVDEVIGPLDLTDDPDPDPDSDDDPDDGTGGVDGDTEPPVDKPFVTPKDIDRDAGDRIADTIEAYRRGFAP